MPRRLELVGDSRESEMRDERSRLGRLPAWVKWTALAVVVVGTILAFIYSGGAERRAIQEMPARERQALFARTVQNLRSVCSEPEDAMRGFCREQAQLALEFRECDTSCQALAARQLSRVQLPR